MHENQTWIPFNASIHYSLNNDKTVFIFVSILGFGMFSTFGLDKADSLTAPHWDAELKQSPIICLFGSCHDCIVISKDASEQIR